jgi:hypothetical protein
MAFAAHESFAAYFYSTKRGTGNLMTIRTMTSRIVRTRGIGKKVRRGKTVRRRETVTNSSY